LARSFRRYGVQRKALRICNTTVDVQLVYNGNNCSYAKLDGMVLLFSIDGAQLSEKKQSDCWVYIWIIFDRAPDICYKKKKLSFLVASLQVPICPSTATSFSFPASTILLPCRERGT
jgi:hypothetical protein